MILLLSFFIIAVNCSKPSGQNQSRASRSGGGATPLDADGNLGGGSQIADKYVKAYGPGYAEEYLALLNQAVAIETNTPKHDESLELTESLQLTEVTEDIETCGNNEILYKGKCQNLDNYCKLFDKGRHVFMPALQLGDTNGQQCIVDDSISCEPYESPGNIEETVEYKDANGDVAELTLKLNVCKPSENNCKKIAKGELREANGNIKSIDSKLVTWEELEDIDVSVCVLSQDYCDEMEKGLYNIDSNRCMPSIKSCQTIGRLMLDGRCVKPADFPANEENCRANQMAYDGYECYPENESHCKLFGHVWMDNQEERDQLKAKRSQYHSFAESALAAELLDDIYAHECQHPDEFYCQLKGKIWHGVNNRTAEFIANS